MGIIDSAPFPHERASWFALPPCHQQWASVLPPSTDAHLLDSFRKCAEAAKRQPADNFWDEAKDCGDANARAAAPDESIEITVEKHNGALNGFNQCTLNGEAFSMQTKRPLYTVHEGRRYRLKFRNAVAASSA